MPLLLDCLDVPFDAYLDLFPAKRWQWPSPEPQRDPAAREAYRDGHPICQMCGAPGREVHHVFGGLFGGVGRSDEPCALIVLCNSFGGCHHWVQGNRNRLAAVLFAKWHSDPSTVNWARMAVLYGLPLPRPDPDRTRFNQYLERTTPAWKEV